MILSNEQFKEQFNLMNNNHANEQFSKYFDKKKMMRAIKCQALPVLDNFENSEIEKIDVITFFNQHPCKLYK